MIKIEGEKKVLTFIIGLIFIVVVALAILISIKGPRSSTGNIVFAGNKEKVEFPEGGQKSGITVETPNEPESAQEYIPENIQTTPPKQVIVLSPYQISEAFSRARNIVVNSQCYRMMGDTREITYYTNLVGQKFIADIVPNEDFSIFQAIIAVKLTAPTKEIVFYKEYPILVDVNQNKIMECNVEPINFEEVQTQPTSYYYQ